MNQNDMYYKELIYNSWFEKITKHYAEMHNGKWCDINVEIRYAPFTKTFTKAYKCNYKHYSSQTDCFSDCMMLVWEALCSFTIADGSTWRAIAEDRDKLNIKRLNNYIKRYVGENMKRLNFDYTETTKLIPDGDDSIIIHVFYRVTPDSLQDIVTIKNQSENIETEVIDTVERSYWEKYDDYKGSIFATWLRENMQDCLTKSQIKFLTELRDAGYNNIDKLYDKEKLEKYKNNMRSKLNRIKDRVTNKYRKEEKYLTGGFVLQGLRDEYNLLSRYTDILDDMDIDVNTKAEQLARHVLNSMDSRYWEHIVYDMLPKEVELVLIKEYQRTTLIHESDFKLYGKRITLSNHILNEISKAVITRLEEIEKAIDREIEYLEQLGEREYGKVELMYFERPEGGYKMVFLNVSPSGIMFQSDYQ